MLRVLAEQHARHRDAAAAAPVGRVRRIVYRNCAPLYAGEPLTVCVRRPPPGGAAEWDVWVEGPDGGLAVRGTAEMEEEEEEEE